MFVGEHRAIRFVGVAADPEPPLMMQPVVFGAQTDEVPRVGGPTLGPVDDVVHLHKPVTRTARDFASTVAVFNETAGPIGHDVLRSADRNRHVVDELDRRHQRVARDPIGALLGDRATTLIRHVTRIVRVEVDAVTTASFG